MIETPDQTYEDIKNFITSLSPAVAHGERVIGFVDANRSIAVARDDEGRLEVFLIGARLSPERVAVGRVLKYREDWQSSGGEPLCANQLILPRDPHFDSAGALICTELISNDHANQPAVAFARIEPLVDRLVTATAQLGDQVLIGLFGELLFLDALTRVASGSGAQDVVDSWFGWRPSSRDFQLGACGIEVKTTTGSTSTHHIQGFHQVEVGHPVTDVAETSLQLLSLGVLALPPTAEHGQSVPALVKQILDRLPSQEGQTRLLARIQQYGGDAGLGYKHDRDHEESRFAQRFAATFERLYDLQDESLNIPRRSDLGQFTHIDLDTVEFDVSLPFPFRGIANPITGLGSIAALLRPQ